MTLGRTFGKICYFPESVTVDICYISEAKASVPAASNKLGDWVTDWVIDQVRDFSPWASSAMKAAKEMKFGIKVA